MSDLVSELRAARPAAPAALRERITELASRAPEPARRRVALPRVRIRRAALVVVLAAVAIAVLGAVVAGLVGSSSRDRHGAASPAARTQPLAVRARDRKDVGETGQALGPVARRARPLPSTADTVRGLDRPTSLPPSRTRLQDYTAWMRVRLDDVDELSDATVHAMRMARGLGGFVVSVRYETPRSERGDSYLTLRVPVARAQLAIMRFSSLGRVIGQDIQITDVQSRVDALERRIVELRGRIGGIDVRLRSAGLSEAERARLEFRRGELVRSLREATRARAGTIRHARFATMSLTLTTAKPEKKEAPPPGRIERTLGDAGAALVKELAWTLFVLAVVAPFALLAVLAIWGVRAARRLGDRHLLESN